MAQPAFEVRRTVDLPDGVLYTFARSRRDPVGVVMVHADHITEECAQAVEAAWHEMLSHYRAINPPLRSVGA